MNVLIQVILGCLTLFIGFIAFLAIGNGEPAVGAFIGDFGVITGYGAYKLG